jgi:hypothetical protein
MDAKAIRRAALITLRRAILERFPPGRERRAWLPCATLVHGWRKVRGRWQLREVDLS